MVWFGRLRSTSQGRFARKTSRISTFTRPYSIYLRLCQFFMDLLIKNKLPLILAIALYILIYFVRLNQGGWEIETEVLKDQRAALDKQLAKYLPSPKVELLSGILLGQDGQLPVGLQLALRDTSTLHIVVASGQNLSMVAGFFFFLSGVIKRKNAIILSFLAVVFYVLLTGAQLPVLRAAIMVTLAFIAEIMGRERDGVWVLIATAGLMLLVNPTWIGSLSFQLSVLATFGVVVVSPIFLEKLKRVPSLISQDIAVSFGAQLMVLPIIAQNFHQISLVALPTNLLVLWTVPFLMIGGAVLLLVSFIPLLGWIVTGLLNILLSYFIYVVEFFGSMPFAWQFIGEQLWVVWVGYYLIIFAILISFKKSTAQEEKDY